MNKIPETFQFQAIEKNVTPPPMFNRYTAVVEAMLALPPKQWHRLKLAAENESTRLRAHLNRKRAQELGVKFTFRTIVESDVIWLYWQHELIGKEVAGKSK